MKQQQEAEPAFETQIINAIRQEEAGTIQGAKLIQAGELVAFPTETVYGLGAAPARQRSQPVQRRRHLARHAEPEHRCGLHAR